MKQLSDFGWSCSATIKYYAEDETPVRKFKKRKKTRSGANLACKRPSFSIKREEGKVSKERLSPIVTIKVEAFEASLAAGISKSLIEKSGKIQRELKTKRIKQKRLFIEERLVTVSTDLKRMEKELREFREYNRNLSSSPSLEMKVQEMGRDIDLQNSLYITLKTQYEKAKIDEVERDDMVQQIDGPSVPSILTSPRRGLSIILGLFFGIFLSIFIIYFQENYIDKNIS